MDNIIYCSLDIETSGFDPVKNEILEIGMAFFEVGDGGLRITEKYTKVFKPNGEVPPNILGLTGIQQEELDSAQPFAIYKEEIQEKLKDAVIVGHNVIFDIKFLQSLGIEFSGQVVDTLELVQFILPTHHSYNLENLMHTFGIDHKEAHRALPDSIASAKVLERLLQMYSGFPEVLRAEITKLLAGRDMPYIKLFEANMKPWSVTPEVISKSFPKAKTKLDLKSGAIYNFPIGKNYLEDLTVSLSDHKEKILLVVPKQQTVVNLWRQKLAEPLLAPEHEFSEKKFVEFLSKPDLTPDEIKFLLKILVWKHTNWQAKYILDLNLSFFGGQFRSSITSGSWPARLPAGVVCCDQETFLRFTEHGGAKSRFVVVSGLSEFEAAVSDTMATKVSWGNILYLLRSVYNPEFGTGENKYKNLVSELLSSSDLFFGLVHALLHTATTNFQYCKVTSELVQSENFQKIMGAAENYREKLIEANKVLQLEDLGLFIEKLQAFFAESSNSIKWIELADKRCVLFSSPLDITGLVDKTIKPYSKISFVDALSSPMPMEYFQKRLGLTDWPLVSIKSLALQQADLFSTQSQKKIICNLETTALSSENLVELLPAGALPAALLFSTGAQVKQFYEQHYQQLQSHAFLLSQNSTGGGNRMFRNFEIHNNSLLIATDKFVLKYLQGAVLPVEHLRVKTLILCHLPFEQFNHPYQESLAEQFHNPFQEFSLPKAAYNFHSLLNFFNTPMLEHIYICDVKLLKEYSKVFKDYVSDLPNLEVIEI